MHNLNGRHLINIIGILEDNVGHPVQKLTIIEAMKLLWNIEQTETENLIKLLLRRAVIYESKIDNYNLIEPIIHITTQL